MRGYGGPIPVVLFVARYGEGRREISAASEVRLDLVNVGSTCASGAGGVKWGNRGS